MLSTYMHVYIVKLAYQLQQELDEVYRRSQHTAMNDWYTCSTISDTDSLAMTGGDREIVRSRITPTVTLPPASIPWKVSA